MADLVTAGCSWTDSGFRTHDTSVEDRGPWPMWPEHVAHHLGMKCINYGRVGCDNKYIFDRIVDEVYSNKNVGMVIAMMTSWDRTCYMGEFKHPAASMVMRHHPDYQQQMELYKWDDEFENIFGNMSYEDFFDWASDIIDTNMRYIFLLSQFLKERNISYRIFQGVPTFPILLFNEIGVTPEFKDIHLIQKISGNRYHNYIKKNKNIIGFPFMKLFNGYNMNHLLNEDDYISELDKHPNKEAQKKIANHVISNL